MSGLTAFLSKRREWIPWLVAAVIACAVVLAWEGLNRREQADMKRSTSLVSDWLHTAIVHDLDQRMSALRRLADRWSSNQGTSRSTWEADVAHYLSDQPGYHAIEWVDASLQERWTMSSSRHAEQLADNDLSLLDIQQLIRILPVEPVAAISPPITLGQLRSGFLAYQPVDRAGQPDGWIIAALEFDSWLNALVNGSTEDLFGVQVLLDEQISFNSSPASLPVDHALVQQRSFSLYGQRWTVRVWLSGTRMAESQSRLSEALLAMGLLVSVLLGWALRASLKSRDESRELLRHYRQLEAQWRNLPGMAYRSNAGNAASIGFVSDGCLELTGYSKSAFEHGGVAWSDLVHPEDRQMRLEQLGGATGNDQSYRTEYRIHCRDGDEKWVWERGNVSGSNHEHSLVIEGLVLDVTDQKLTEIALTDATTYARTVVDTAAEAIITISTQGEVESINRSASMMFGYSRDELIGKNIKLLMPWPYMNEHDAYMERYLRTGEKRIIGIGREVSGRRRDGSVFPIQLSVSEFVAKDERKFVGLIRDLTEQQLAKQEASLHRERLAHVGRVNMLGEMATGIAHEINQPLSAISMYAQSGLRFLDADPPRLDRLRDALEKLSTQAHRAGAVIERMQQFARQRESRYEPIDCNRLMQEVAHLAESEALIRDAEISLEIDTSIGIVTGDPVQLQQVALNLLRNGMESMESIGHRYGNHILLKTQSEEKGVRVSVIDQGTGVSAAAAEQLYKPFASTKEMGMGIGLSICKSIIHSHGGQLDFANAEDHGATFFFTLPYTA